MRPQSRARTGPRSLGSANRGHFLSDRRGQDLNADGKDETMSVPVEGLSF